MRVCSELLWTVTMQEEQSCQSLQVSNVDYMAYAKYKWI